MAKKQQSFIEKKLEELRANYLLATDTTIRGELEQEIESLEKQLLEASPTNNFKNVIRNADLSAGGDIHVGDVTNVYQYGTEEKQIEEPVPLNWKKWMAIIASIGLLLGVLLCYNWKEWVNHQPEIIGAFPIIPIAKDSIPSEQEKPTVVIPVEKDLSEMRSIKVIGLSEDATNLLKENLNQEKSWLLTNGKNSEVKIEINYSGTLEPKGEQYYRFSGGAVQIKVNNELCCCEGMDMMQIDLKGSRVGNRKPVLERQLKKKIDQLLFENLNDVIEKIKACVS